jgi:cytochrome c oxidase assembly protein subunit 15
MSVPDWPTTYGYNMFLFPVSRWIGGVLYEHTHRLLASFIGIVTLMLGVMTFFLEQRRWVRRLAWLAIASVILQGVLGGLRVTLYKDEIGIFHGILAQSFFALLLIFSAATSRPFMTGEWFGDASAFKLRWLAVTAVVLIYFQLIIAATMRHAHLGLAIPDFPTAYGSILPSLSEKALATINAARLAQAMMPTTATQIVLQLLHRGGALLLLGIVLLFMIRSRELLPKQHWVHRWSLIWGGIVIAQATLGVWTIWSNKAADVATAHMTLGALLLGGTMLLTFRLFVAGNLPHEINEAVLS